jgi:Cu2+-containing amine oxidase
VFELSLGQPLLRHWGDAGGSSAYYGAVQGSVLVVRTISTVYNYDYIAVSNACRGTAQAGHWFPYLPA